MGPLGGADDSGSVINHLVEGDGDGGSVALDDISEGVANEDGVDAGLVDEASKGGVVGGDNGDGLLLLVAVLERSEGDGRGHGGAPWAGAGVRGEGLPNWVWTGNLQEGAEGQVGRKVIDAATRCAVERRNVAAVHGWVPRSVAMWKRLVGLSMLATLWASGCGAPLNTQVPLDEIRALNTDVSVIYTRTNTTLNEASMMSASFAELPEGILASDFDAELLRNVMSACFTAKVEMVPGSNPDAPVQKVTALRGSETNPLTDRLPLGRVKPCRASNLLALESYAEVVTPEIREFVLTRALEADAQRANLQDAAKSQLAQLGRRRELAEGELDKLKATADERLHNARIKDDGKELKRAESDYEAFEKEWATIDQLLEEITEAFKGLEQTRRTLVEETSKNIAKLGLSK